MKLDLTALAVESFDLAANPDPAEWLMMAPPPTIDTRVVCCPVGADVAERTRPSVCNTTY